MDFFAGSGTTLNATCMLNACDGGSRQCILVTNNELHPDDADALRAQGATRGDSVYEAEGICRSITYPRCRCAILGKNERGEKVENTYALGDFETVEKPVRVTQLPLLNGAGSLSKEAQDSILKLLKLPMSDLAAEGYYIHPENSTAVLFTVVKESKLLKEVQKHGGIETIYVCVDKKSDFNCVRNRIKELELTWTDSVEKSHDGGEGFLENLQYLRLGYLDPSDVEMGNCLGDLLNVLWLMSGAYGAPEAPPKKNMPFLFGSTFGLLVKESCFRSFIKQLKQHPEVTHVFLITDSEHVFNEMLVQMRESGAAASRDVIHLYRNYLENFCLNSQDR